MKRTRRPTCRQGEASKERYTAWWLLRVDSLNPNQFEMFACLKKTFDGVVDGKDGLVGG